MGNKNKTKDVLPETFETEREAGEFWDTHSIIQANSKVLCEKPSFEVSY